MTQRVNIQYSVKMADLEPELSRLLSLALEELSALSADNISVPVDLLSLSAREHLDSVRQSLAIIDVRISEVNAMIEAYLAYKTQQAMPQPETVAASTQELPDFNNLPENIPGLDMSNPDLAVLRERIEAFRRDSTLNSGEVSEKSD